MNESTSEEMIELMERLMEAAEPPFALRTLEECVGEIGEGQLLLEAAWENLNRPLMVSLLGGTGVGKSTLLNALAGREVAHASAIRPTTIHCTLYGPDNAKLEALADQLDEDGLFGEIAVVEAPASLEGKLLVDAPDFDSEVHENRERLLRILEATDLVLVVANRIKYRHGELFALLARFQKSKSFAFAMNGVDDPLFSGEILEDYEAACKKAGFERMRLFAVSAKEALEHKVGPEETAQKEIPGWADFERLERYLEEELHERQIREIKSSNLAKTSDELVNQLTTLVGPRDAVKQRLGELEGATLPNIFEAMHEELIRRVRLALFDGGGTIDLFIDECRSKRLTGTFGLVVGGAQRLRRMGGIRAAALKITARDLAASSFEDKDGGEKSRQGSGSRQPGAAQSHLIQAGSLSYTQAFIAQQLEAEFATRLTTPTRKAEREAKHALEAEGFSQYLIKKFTHGWKQSGFADRLVDRLDADLQHHVEERARRSERTRLAPPWNFVEYLLDPWSLLPNAILFIALYYVLTGFFVGEAKFGMLVLGVMLAVIVCLLELSYYMRRVSEARAKFRELLLHQARESIDEEIEASLLPPLEKALDSYEQQVSEIYEIADNLPERSA